MNKRDRHLLAVLMAQGAKADISNAILSMSGRDFCEALRHLAAAKAYFNAMKSWMDCADYKDPITRRLDEVIEAVCKKHWKEAWRLCWDLLYLQEFLASYQPDEEPPWDEQGSGDRDEGDIA